jgi:hypothetical protein
MTYVDPQIPPTERVVEVRREGNSTGWIVAGIVAVVAVIAVAFMLTQRPADTNQDQLLQAQEQGRAAGVIEGAQSSVATSAQQAQFAAENAARNAGAAADEARRETERAAANASQAAQDAADRVAASGDSRAPSVDAPPASSPQ